MAAARAILGSATMRIVQPKRLRGPYLPGTHSAIRCSVLVLSSLFNWRDPAEGMSHVRSLVRRILDHEHQAIVRIAAAAVVQTT